MWPGRAGVVGTGRAQAWLAGLCSTSQRLDAAAARRRALSCRPYGGPRRRRLDRAQGHEVRPPRPCPALQIEPSRRAPDCLGRCVWTGLVMCAAARDQRVLNHDGAVNPAQDACCQLLAPWRRTRVYASVAAPRAPLQRWPHKNFRAASKCLEMLGAEYDPREDTCIKAFVRLLALQAQSEQSSQSSSPYCGMCVLRIEQSESPFFRKNVNCRIFPRFILTCFGK